MPRLVTLVLVALALVACSAPTPLYTPEPKPVVEFVLPEPDDETGPMSLTASDGTGLELQRVDVEAVVDDPVALTEMALTFKNPKEAQVEGRFELRLPPGAMIARFAMKVAGEWQEGEVIERTQAREAYESFIHAPRPRDPALLEVETGNRFSARVFPIAPSGVVEIELSYLETFREPGIPYRLALRGFPRVGKLEARVQVRPETAWSTHHVEGRVPREDFVVPRNAPQRTAWRHDERALARVQIPTTGDDLDRPASLTILFDTSASRVVGYDGKVDRLDELVDQLRRYLDPATKLVVLPFDQAAGRPVFAGPIENWAGSNALARLKRRKPLGATDLERSLRAAVLQETERIVVITDGMTTVGSHAAARLPARVEALADAGVRRIDVIAGRDQRDEALLETLTSGVLIDAELSPEEIGLRLVRPLAPSTTVAVAGARRVWPDRLDHVQAGDAAFVYVELDKPRKRLDITLTPEGQEPTTQRVAIRDIYSPAFEQAWVRADVAQQLAAGGTKAELARLSVEHRILNDLTAFVVLETDADYRNWGIARRSEEAVGRLNGTTSAESAYSTDAVHMRVETRAVSVSSGYSFSASADYVSSPLPRMSMSFPVYRAVRRADVEHRRTSTPDRADKRRSKDALLTRLPALRTCWFHALNARTLHGGAVTVDLHLDDDGRVRDVELVRRGAHLPQALRRCLDRALRHGRYDGVRGPIRHSFQLKPGKVPPMRRTLGKRGGPQSEGVDLHGGRLTAIKRLIADDELARAERLAWAWRDAAPDDLMALVAIGDVALARGKPLLASRAYGSIAELYPAQAPMLRFAAGRLERLGKWGLDLGIDLLFEARKQRPDHPSSHRALAWALARRKRYRAAFEVLNRSLDQVYPSDRFPGIRRAMALELAVIGAAWVRTAPKEATRVGARLGTLGVTIPDAPSLRFVLTWETDASDVDLYVRDATGNSASYRQPELESGGALDGDITRGYGPESFVIEGEPEQYPYELGVHYYTQGPSGSGMGQIQSIYHDGEGRLQIRSYPFVATKDGHRLGVAIVREDLPR